MIQKLKKNKKGFTLVELIVVVAILGVLMAVLVPQYIQYVEKSKQGTDASALGQIIHAVEVEAALQDVAAGTTFTITVDANKEITTASSLAALKTGVDAVAGTTVANELKLASKASTSFTIVLTSTATGDFTYNLNAEEFIAALTAGTAASATKPVAP